MNDRRPAVLIIFVVLIALALLAKLFIIQVAEDSFLRRAERNAIQRIVAHPCLAPIYYRNNTLMVFHNPVFYLSVIRNDFHVADTALFSELFRTLLYTLISNYNAAK